MQIAASCDKGRLTVALSGELDHHEAKELMQRLDEWIDDYLPREFVLDLSGLSFMDSSGIAVMIRISRRMKELGGRVWMDRPAGQPRRVIEAAGIERLIPVAVVK